MFCSNCGKELPENVAICPNCGTVSNSQSQPADAVAEVPAGAAGQSQAKINFANPISCLTEILKHRYAKFQGRASRSEFWFYTLWYALICLFLLIINAVMIAIAYEIFGENDSYPDFIDNLLFTCSVIIDIALMIPFLALLCRRFQDRNLPGWLPIVLYFTSGLVIPLIVLVVFLCQKGTVGTNRFGEDPLK